MAKIVFALIITILLSALLQSPAFAAEITRPPSKAVSSGELSASSTIGSYFFAGSEQRNTTPLYGIKIGYEKIEKSIADSLGIEGTLNYFSTGSKAGGSNDTGYLYRLDANYAFPINKKWRPYITVGAGGITIASSTDTSSNFLFNYGVGIKFFIENYLAVRADARQLVVYESSNIRNNYEVGVGLSYYFGKERAKKPAPKPLLEIKKIVIPEDVPVKAEEVVKPAETDTSDKQPTAPIVEASVSLVVKNEVLKKFSIEFDNNSSKIKPYYYEQLKEIRDILKRSDDGVALIEGHSDVKGNLAANIALSEQRARSVQSNLIKSGVNPKQLSITAHGPAQPIADNETVDGRQKNRRVDIQVEKINPAAKIKAEQELQNAADRLENARLEAAIRAKSRIKAAIELQEVSGTLPVDSNNSLSFKITNQGIDTEEFIMTITAPKEFDAFLARVNRPDEKISTLRLAPGETFKGNVLFRIPAGMVDGHRAIVSVKAVSPKFSDVFFQKESLVVSSAPLVRVVAKLSKQQVTPGEKLLYRLSLLNAGTLTARNLTVKLQLPPQVDVTGTPDMPFTREAPDMIIFTVDALDSGKRMEITVDMKVREDSVTGKEILWIVEVVDGDLRRAKSTNRVSIVPSK